MGCDFKETVIGQFSSRGVGGKVEREAWVEENAQRRLGPDLAIVGSEGDKGLGI